MNEGHWRKRINQGLSIVQRFFPGRGWLRSLQFTLVGLVIAISLYAGIAGQLMELMPTPQRITSSR
jgi:hypothetical protein